MTRILNLEKIALLLAPAIGLGVVIIFQFGRSAALGVPFELLELNPVSTFLAALTITAFCMLSVFSLAVLFQREDLQARKYLPMYHIAAAVVLTVPFWSEDVGLNSKVSWPIVFYIIFASLVTYSTHKNLKVLLGHSYSEKPKSEITHGLLANAFWLLLLISLSTVSLGVYAESKPKSRVFLVGTSHLFVGKFNGLLIFKPLEDTGKSGNKKVILLPPDKEIELEERANVALGR